MQDLVQGIGRGLVQLKAQQRLRYRAHGQPRALKKAVAGGQVGLDAGISAAHSSVDANALEGLEQFRGEARIGEVMVEQPAVARPGRRLGFRQPIKRWQPRIGGAEPKANAAELPPGDLLQCERPVDARFSGIDGFGQIEGLTRLHGVGGAGVQGVAGLDVQIGAVHALGEQRQGLLDIGQRDHGSAMGSTASTMSAKAACTVRSSDTAATKAMSAARRASMPLRMSRAA